MATKRKSKIRCTLVQCRNCKTEQIIKSNAPLKVYGPPDDELVMAPCQKPKCGSRFGKAIGVFDPKKGLHVRRVTSVAKEKALNEMIKAAFSLHWYFGHAGTVRITDQPAVNFREAMNRWSSAQGGYNPDDIHAECAWNSYKRRIGD